MSLDANQIIRKCYDSATNSLKVKTLLILPESEPTDGSLQNTQAVIWYDSGTIKMKHKDSGGTVRNGTLGTVS